MRPSPARLIARRTDAAAESSAPSSASAPSKFRDQKAQRAEASRNSAGSAPPIRRSRSNSVVDTIEEQQQLDHPGSDYAEFGPALGEPWLEHGRRVRDATREPEEGDGQQRERGLPSVGVAVADRPVLGFLFQSGLEHRLVSILEQRAGPFGRLLDPVRRALEVAVEGGRGIVLLEQTTCQQIDLAVGRGGTGIFHGLIEQGQRLRLGLDGVVGSLR